MKSDRENQIHVKIKKTKREAHYTPVNFPKAVASTHPYSSPSFDGQLLDQGAGSQVLFQVYPLLDCMGAVLATPQRDHG
jgi:hypothetical protein